ncbi:MAG: IS110 family transposase [Cytophagaceae bacterium]|nr:MAG: IS110 family transposase [Cytophagaceae bacterium]
MNQPVHFVGVDVSKDTLHTNYQTGTDAKKQPLWHYQLIDNQMLSIEAWAAELPTNTQVIFEHTGTYSARLPWVLAAQGIAFTALLASQSAGFAKTLKSISKSDRRDAVLLTRYGQINQPEPTQLAPENLHQLRQAQRYLHQLRVQYQAATNRLHALSYDPRAAPRIVASLTLIAATLQEQILAFESDQDQLTQLELTQIQARMQRVSGIGPASAQALCVATNGLSGFDSAKAVVKYVGIAPRQSQSGTSVRSRGRLVGTSVGYVRGVLYMAARSARRYNQSCKALYERLRGRGKCHRVAMMAVINKLLHQVFAVVKHDAIFMNGHGMPQ